MNFRSRKTKQPLSGLSCARALRRAVRGFPRRHLAICSVWGETRVSWRHDIKQTRRGSCDQRGELPGAKLSGIGCTRRLSQKPSPDERMIQGSILVSNGNGADRNLHRSMRLHAGTEVLSCGRHIPARLHCTVPDPRVNNAATRSRRGRGTWISSRVSDPTPRHRKVRSPTKVAAGNPPAKW